MPYDYSSTDYGSVDRTHSTDNKWNIVSSDKKDNSVLDSSDFLNLMVAALQNQDFMNPTDSSQYVSQMAEFSNMQQMSLMASYSKSSYAMSLVGKNVTASRFTFSGDLETETGLVEKVSLVDNEYVIYVNGKKYTMDQVMEVQTPAESGKCVVDPSKSGVIVTNIKSDSADIKWNLPTEDTAIAKNLKYKVYYSADGPFDTLTDVLAGTQVGGEYKGITDGSELKYSLSDLEPGTTYYVNVVVEDENGNKAIYKPVKVSTTRV